MLKIRGTYKVVVCDFGREDVVVDLCNTDEQFKSMTVLQLKEKIRKGSQVPLPEGGDFRLIFMQKQLNDSYLLIAYGIEHMSVIHLIPRLCGGGNPAREDGGMGGKGGKSKKNIDGCALNIFINPFQIDEASTEARHQPEK